MTSSHSQRRVSSWTPLPAPWSEAALSASTLNPLQSRTWTLPISQHAQKHLWAIQTYLKVLKGRWWRYSAHPTVINLKLSSHTLSVLPKCLLSCPAGGGEISISGSAPIQCPTSGTPLSLAPTPKLFSHPPTPFLDLQASLPPSYKVIQLWLLPRSCLYTNTPRCLAEQKFAY